MASCSLSLNLVLIFLPIFSSLWTCPGASSRDTLKPGDALNSSSSLVSANGQFTLAFKVSDDNSNSSYLVIKWAGINNYAWVANPNTPILYPLGILTLDTNHTLKITHKGGDPITLFSAPETNNIAVVATLLDSGNFVLQQINSDDGSTKRILWQSFDYPGDTLLPGMKLGVNHKNSHIWSLSSWFTPISAAPGAFTLDWDPIEHQLKIRRHGVVYWSSGAFESGRFKFVDLADDSKYNFSVVSNENEDYFTYTSVEQSEWLLSISGRLFEFESNHDIARADNCYGHNTDGGCQRYSEDQPIGCRHLIGDRFEQEKGYFNPTNRTSSNVKSTTTSDSNRSLGLSDCKAACWRNCDCFGFNPLLDNQTGCKFWIGNWEFVQDRSGYSSASPYFLAKSSSKARSTKKWIWIGTGIAAALLLCIVCLLLIRRRNFIRSGQNGTKIQEVLNLMEYNRPIDVNGLQNEGMGHHHLSVFSYASVMAATSNFSMENKLGEGGFGTVYKGKLVTGQEIAVKRLSECSGQGTLEFKNELILIYELQHTNLVRLFGFCIHNEERMLIYEYMPNRSLEHFIFDPTKGQLLDWKKRFSIIEGIAQGLLYLHKYSRMTVIHRDLKASNILLDESMNPKISDFGMARIFTRNEQLEASTDRVVGTYGYMSPEYMMGFFSIKSDVYSFGVLMLEIISGRKNNSFYTAHRMHHLVGHAWELWKEGAWLELIDPTVGNSCIPDQLLRCIHVGLLCVEENAADRPTMSDVISMLTNESMALPIPIKPAFCTERNVVTTDVGGMATKSRSLNDSMSFSNFGGR